MNIYESASFKEILSFEQFLISCYGTEVCDNKKCLKHVHSRVKIPRLSDSTLDECANIYINETIWLYFGTTMDSIAILIISKGIMFFS